MYRTSYYLKLKVHANSISLGMGMGKIENYLPNRKQKKEKKMLLRRK